MNKLLTVVFAMLFAASTGVFAQAKDGKGDKADKGAKAEAKKEEAKKGDKK